MPDLDLDVTFAALADPTRRTILARLTESDANVTDLTAMFDLSQPAVSKHLKVLEGAGLITRHQDKQHRLCRAEPKALAHAMSWIGVLRQLLESRYEQLDQVLQEMKYSAEGGRDQ